jgi:crotonyl-CoA carboxylase/reductase
LKRDAFAIGEQIPVGVVPKLMHAWVIRADRHGPPATSFQRELIEVPEIGDDDVLILVMAAGVNYNGVWAGLGQPVSPIAIHGCAAHIAGSDAAGIVWAVGANVRRWRVGDEVIVQCAQMDRSEVECNGGDPMLASSQRIWGYETSFGSFAQFSRVQQTQLLARPQHLSWEASACYMLVLATAWRMLFGHPPHVVKPGKSVLIWGGAGGLGSMAIQLCRNAGAFPIAVVSDDERADYTRERGAAAVINRRQFNCWGPPRYGPGRAEWFEEVKSFGRAIRQVTPSGGDVDIVFEHPGRETFAVSTMVARSGGMIVYCGATTGYDFQFDARQVWMRQKRIQGSHYADLKQANEANSLVHAGQIDPCLSRTFDWDQLADAHGLMLENRQPPGNMAVLVQASRS